MLRAMTRHVVVAVRALAPAGLAVAAFLLLAAPAGPPAAAWLGLTAGGAAVLTSLAANRWPRRRRASGGSRRGASVPGGPALGAGLPARLLVAAGVLAHAAQGPLADRPGVLAAGGALLLGALLAEPLLHRLARPWYEAVHLPACRPSVPARLVGNGAAWTVTTGAVLLAGLAAVAAPPGPGVTDPAAPTGAAGLAVTLGFLLPALLAAATGGWLVIDGARRWRTGHRDELARLTAAVAAQAPRFLLYFSAPPGSEYQAKMWLPYLDQLGAPYLVVLPEGHNAPAVAAATGAPVVVCETFEALDAVMVPGLRVAFYVNNGMKNAHCVRYPQLTHVQLYHGDSDKAVTASPLNQLFDRIFVAGQAAVDRFAAHGVQIPADRFRIVGRPQVARLAVADRPIGEITDPVVLYAPTWVGAHADSHYCSLPVAESIIEQALARGLTVILRPHPYSRRDRDSAAQLRRAEALLAADRHRAGRAHRWGAAASEQLSLFGCMDASDAMICDVSSVASDYLYTGKPFAITDMRGDGDQFPRTFPVARAAYRIDADAGNLPAVLDDLLARDPLAADRAQLRTYYLGDIPPEQYAAAFFAEARRLLPDPQPTHLDRLESPA